jgi:hypothetical protein
VNINDADAYPFTKAFNYGQVPLAPVHLVERPVSAPRERLTSPAVTRTIPRDAAAPPARPRAMDVLPIELTFSVIPRTAPREGMNSLPCRE